ncbi:MAG TPA: AraC family transcriptional regulator CmrA, partial [Cyanobacteria bacterium UBA8543]|nr:AraC family transcriptional regulator CmrA [Cyanobacteria bacterium UBA8543]
MIVDATPDQPYLCFKLSLDATQLWNIIDQIQHSKDNTEDSVRGLFVSDADELLIDC